MSEHALATVEPTIRSPGECVESFVRVLVSPAIEQDLRFSGGFRFVAIFDRNEHQVRSSAYPDATEANFKSADEIEAFHENGAAIEFSVTVCIFENEDAVLALAL